MVPNEEIHILTIHFEPPKRGQPLYKGRDAMSQVVLYNGGVHYTHIRLSLVHLSFLVLVGFIIIIIHVHV